MSMPSTGPSTGPSMGPSEGNADSSAHPVNDVKPADAPAGKVIYVNSAQVKAAQLLVDLAKRRKEPVDPAVVAIANAKRVNGYATAAAS